MKEPESENKALRSYYSTRVQLKIKEMKLRLAIMDDKMSKSVGSSANKDLKTMQTKKRFTSLGSNNNMLVHKDEQSGRMAGTHSYNVLDSEAYIETKRIESRIYAFDKKIREKQIREAERAAKFA